MLQYLEAYVSPKRRERFIQVLATRTRYLTVAMEDVFQLHNASAVLRSCEVFGIQDLHLIENRFGRRLDKNIAMGAQQWVDVYRYGSALECMETLRAKGYRIIATTPGAEACALDDFSFDGPSALFFGTEKEGLSKAVFQGADSRLRIPMAGFTESLNISVAAAIILYRLSAVLRSSDLPWRLSEREILDKRLDWTMKSVKSLDGLLARYRKDHMDEG